jgi:hypothetical protein
MDGAGRSPSANCSPMRPGWWGYEEIFNTGDDFRIHLPIKEAESAELYRQAIAAFDGNVPSFHIELFDKPVMVWDFYSLMAVIYLVLGLMITDENQPLRSCKYCNRAFVAKRPKAEYCKLSCKNKHNVYKSRGKE